MSIPKSQTETVFTLTMTVNSPYLSDKKLLQQCQVLCKKFEKNEKGLKKLLQAPVTLKNGRVVPLGKVADARLDQQPRPLILKN